MDVPQIVLRILHIGAGVFWVGSSAFLLFMVEPTAKALGPQGGPFMAHMATKRKMPLVFAVSALVNVAAGITLYWRDTRGFDLDLIATPVYLAFGIGGLLAIITFALGLFAVRPAVVGMAALASSFASSPPGPEQLAELGRLQRRVHTLSVWSLILLSVTVAAMASAQYL